MQGEELVSGLERGILRGFWGSEEGSISGPHHFSHPRAVPDTNCPFSSCCWGAPAYLPERSS